MAYWIDSSQKYTGTRQIKFFMDSDEDTSLLPTSTEEGTEQDDTVTHLKVSKGSSAFSIASGKTYILDSTDNWQEVGGTPSNDNG